MNRIDFPTFSYLIISIMGGLLMWVGALTKELIYASIGGALIGTGISGLIEIFKKKSQYDDFNNILKNSLNPEGFKSREEDIKAFRRKWHLYWSTVNNSGLEFWNYTVLDFSKKPSVGNLTAELKLLNYEKKEFNYNLEAFKKDNLSPFTMIHQSLSHNEARAIYIFQDLNLEALYGFQYHMDWQKERRISCTIMSPDPFFKNQKTGPLDNSQGDELQSKWDQNFKRKTRIFTNKS
ncbi:MAG: hypothetical protein R8G66_11310 [Cytophagales bacterium]|nr:hypothetical protein [Cytophagales bacterium]